MKIYKYPIDTSKESISLPSGAKILSIQLQRGKPVLWAAVKDGAPTIKCRMKLVPTGGDVDPTDMPWYKGTIIETVDDVDFVWHVFIVI